MGICILGIHSSLRKYLDSPLFSTYSKGESCDQHDFCSLVRFFLFLHWILSIRSGSIWVWLSFHLFKLALNETFKHVQLRKMFLDYIFDILVSILICSLGISMGWEVLGKNFCIPFSLHFFFFLTFIFLGFVAFLPHSFWGSTSF